MAAKRWPMLPIIGVLTTACATTDSGQLATEKQVKARGDLDACNASTGNKAYRIRVTPDGRYTFMADGEAAAQAVLDCMRGKGYAARLVDQPQEHGPRLLRPFGGAGE